jgi:hypothetical protein
VPPHRQRSHALAGVVMATRTLYQRELHRCNCTGAAKRDKGNWQRRYWEHAIRDDGDPSCRCASLFDH